MSGDLDVLIDAYALRAVVDGLAARLAAHRARDGHQQLLRLIQQQELAIKPWRERSYTRANVDFHEAILHLSGNSFVIDQAPLLRMTAHVFAPVALIQPSTAVRAIREHSLIAEAIGSGDHDASEMLARRHIETTALELEAMKEGGSSTLCQHPSAASADI